MTKPLSPVTSPATAQNGSIVRICGVDYQDCEVIRDGDQPAIKTRAKEFWLSPVCDENGAKVERLPRWLPREIRRITFQPPDLTKEFPATVKALFNRWPRVPPMQARQDENGNEFQEERKLAESQQDVERLRRAREIVWEKHKSPELADKHGYLGSDRAAALILGILQHRNWCIRSDAEGIVRGLQYEMTYDGVSPQFIYLDDMEEVTRPQNDAPDGEAKLAAVQRDTQEIKASVSCLVSRKREKDRKSHQYGPRSRAKWKGHESVLAAAVRHARRFLNPDWKKNGIKRGKLDSAIGALKAFCKGQQTEHLLSQQNKQWLRRCIRDDWRKRRSG